MLGVGVELPKDFDSQVTECITIPGLIFFLKHFFRISQ